MNTRAKPRRVRVYTRLSATLRDRLTGYCAASGIAECAVFEAALQQYVGGTSDLTLVLRRLNRLGREGARIHRDLELLSEAFGVFVRLWFAHTPSIPEEGKPTARSTADNRYRQFVEHVTQRFSTGRRFLDELPHQSVANDVELDAIAANPARLPDPQGKKKNNLQLSGMNRHVGRCAARDRLPHRARTAAQRRAQSRRLPRPQGS